MSLHVADIIYLSVPKINRCTWAADRFFSFLARGCWLRSTQVEKIRINGLETINMNSSTPSLGNYVRLHGSELRIVFTII